MNEERKKSLPRRRWKNGHPKSSSVLIYLPFAIVHSHGPPCVKKNNNNQTPQTKAATAKKHAPPQIFPSAACAWYSFCPSKCRTQLSLSTLLLANPFAGCHLCTADTLIRPGFVLHQKGEGFPSGFTLIAVWEHRTGLLSTSPLLSSFIPRSHPLALHHTFPLSQCLLYILLLYFPPWIFLVSSISCLLLYPVCFFYFDSNYPEWA